MCSELGTYPMDMSRLEAEPVYFWKAIFLQNSQRSYYIQISKDHLLAEVKALEKFTHSAEASLLLRLLN